jgi:hypothetical protein
VVLCLQRLIPIDLSIGGIFTCYFLNFWRFFMAKKIKQINTTYIKRSIEPFPDEHILCYTALCEDGSIYTIQGTPSGISSTSKWVKLKDIPDEVINDNI